MINSPQLRYDTNSFEFGLWVLSPANRPDGDSVEMLIECYWDGDSWFRYHFIQWIDGEWFELVTKKQFDKRKEDIALNEGDEIADLWELEQNQCLTVRDGHGVFGLQKHWEAMMQLNLFQPHRSGLFKSKQLPSELLHKLDDLRTKQYTESMVEFDKEVSRQSQGGDLDEIRQELHREVRATSHDLSGLKWDPKVT